MQAMQVALHLERERGLALYPGARRLKLSPEAKQRRFVAVTCNELDRER